MIHFLDELVTIKTLKSSGGVKRTYAATATAEASVQPLGKETAGISDGVYGKTFIVYLPYDVPVKISDHLQTRHGDQYSVTDVVEREFGATPYKEVIVKKT